MKLTGGNHHRRWRTNIGVLSKTNQRDRPRQAGISAEMAVKLSCAWGQPGVLVNLQKLGAEPGRSQDGPRGFKPIAAMMLVSPGVIV